MRQTTLRQTELQQEALSRATQSQALTNYPTIFEEFTARGIPESEIRPRENVFTYNAWKALGRQVRKGEHGVHVITWITISEKNPLTGVQEPTGKRPKTTTVFHVSQTDSIGA